MNEKSDVSSQPRENLFGLFIFLPIVCAHIIHFRRSSPYNEGLNLAVDVKGPFPLFSEYGGDHVLCALSGGKEEKGGSCKGHHHKPAAVYQEKRKQIKKRPLLLLRFSPLFPPSHPRAPTTNFPHDIFLKSRQHQ